MLPAISKMFCTGRSRSSMFAVCVMSLFAMLLPPWASATNTPSTTVLTISPASPQTGGTVQTLTATVTATSGGASVTPGVVNFYDLTSVAAAGPGGGYTARPLLLGTAQLKTNGTASIKVVLGASATHTLTAKFLRNATYAASTSASVPDVINPGQHNAITLTTTGNANYNNGSSPRDTYNMDVLFTYHGYTAPSGSMSFSNTATSAVLGTTNNLVRGYGSPYPQVNEQVATPSVTAGTSAVAKGDFNGDGNLDIVATNTSAATVSVYLGNGDGTFGSETTYAVASAASNSLAGIAVGDFNGDGKLDIAVPNSTTGNVSILLGNGDGTFATHVEYTTPTNPNRIVVGDFNEDGNLDLMVAGGSGSSYSVSLLLGDGSGGFSSSTSLTNTPWTNNAAGVTDMVVADFNGDGHLDLLTDCYSCENFALFKGNGDGTFQPVVGGYPPQPNLPWGLAVGDWNGDGIPDIAFAAPGTGGGQVYLALNDGTGSFSHVVGVAFGGSPKWIGAADMNGDGWPDLVSTNYSSGSFSVATSNPASASATAFGFATVISQTGSAHPGTMVAGDFHGSGLNDFVVAAPSTLNLFQYGLGNEAAVGSTYYGQSPIVLTSTTSLTPNSFNASYIPATSDIYGTAISNIVALPVYGIVTPTLSVSQNSFNYGQSPVFTLNVPSLSGTVPTGTAEIYNYYGFNVVGSATLTSGAGSYTLSVPNAGTYGVTAQYDGDANYVASSSTVNTQFTVVPETPTLSVTSSPSTQIVGGNVTLSATVGVTANAHAGIVVNLALGGAGASCTTNSSGQCSATIVMPGTGAQAVTAHVVATQNLTTANATGSTSPTGYQITSTPVLTVSLNPSFPTQTVTLTATLPVVSGFTPSGFVNFNEGNNTLGSGNVNGSGVATFSTSALGLGSHPIVAAYSGDSTFLSANSSTLTQVVAAASFAVALSTPSTVTQGSPTTLIATVTANSNSVNPALVQFYDSSSSPQLLGTASTNSSGVATLLRVLSAGTHSIHAVFTGQAAGNTGVSSVNRSAIVTGNGTLATLTGLSLLGSPGSYTLSAPVALSGSAPTGSVNFLDASNGNAVIGTGTVGSFTRSVATPAYYLLGANPPGIFSLASATGDLNGDGILDLVIANYTDGGGNGAASITVLLGVGDGTFTTSNTFGAFDPSSLTLADVDQDGILDLLVTRDGNNDMQVYHGVGDGTFTQLGYGVNGGFFPIGLGVADFDKDGIPDLVITSNASGARFVHGNGDGTFGQYGSGTNFNTGNNSIGITVGDYNRDGNPDFIVTNATDGTVGVFLGDGTGNFASQQTYAVGNYPNSIVTGDFNADGKPDIAVTNQTDHTIGILLGNGDGTFQTMTTYSAGSNGPGNITIADLNGDGKDDLIVTNTVTINGSGFGVYDSANGGNHYDDTHSDNTVGIFTSNGDGTFQAMTTVSTGSGTIPYATVIGDFNGDGLPDFAVPNSATDNIGVFLGRRSGTATLTGSAVNSAGPVQVKASYIPGTADAYATSISSAVQLVGSSTPTLTSSINPSPNGSALTFTASLPTLGGVPPTGTITFKDGATTLGTGTLSSGSATYTTSALSTATHSVTAVYSGDSHYVTATSALLSQVITIPTTSIALVTSQTPRVYGNSVTFTATLGSSTATGTVAFLDGATTLGTGTITSGLATFSTSALTAGSHSITGVYSGDSNYSNNTSSALTQVVTQSSAAATTLATSGTPVGFGTAVTFTATVGSSTATGTVQFKDGTTLLGTGTVTAGIATYTTSALAIATHSITAVYSGDTNYATSTSSALSQVVTLSAAATTTLTSSANPSTSGASVTFTATLGSSAATGTVQFKDGSTVLGIGTITAGVATYTTGSLSTATHSITAVYSGDSNYATSTSATLSQVVSVQVTVTLGTSTSLNNFAPSISTSYGQTAYFSASVAPYSSGTASPSGAVVHFVTASGILIGNVAPVSGVATVGTSTLTVGTNLILVSYTDSLGQPAVTSSTVTVTVAQATPTLAVPTLSPAGASYGANVTITQAVPTYVTGTITFYNGSAVLGTGTIASGVATLTTNTLPVGTNTITTSFGGNANVAAATSSAGSIVITQATTSLGALTVTPSSAVFGTTVTITQAVPAGLTGTVNFFNTPGNIGSAPIVGGAATFTTTTLPVGTDVIQTIYGGDANHTSSNGGPVNAIITAATSSVALSTSTTSASYGTSVVLTSTVTVSGAPLTSGAVTFLAGGVSIGTGALNGSGTATLATTTLAVGANVVTASLTATANFTSSTSAPVTVTLTQATPTLPTPTASSSLATFGTSITLTQTVPAGVNGTITFYNGSSSLGSANIVGGVALFTTSILPPGTNTITASFPGNTNYAAATSPSTTVTISAAATATALVATPNSASYGTSVVLSATVTSAGTPVSLGTVQFTAGGVTLGSGTVTANGVATLSTTTLAAGVNSVLATYSASPAYSGSTATATVTITQAAPTLSAPSVSPASASYGTPVTLTQAVPPGVTGTITFLSGTTVLGTATIVNGVATLTTSSLPGGANAITASFGGNANYGAAASAPSTITISPVTPTLVAPSASPASAPFGAAVTLTQAVPAGATGTVTFSANGVTLGTATIVNGVATLTTTALPSGTNAVTGSFAGNANYTAAASPALSVTIAAPGTALAAPTASPTTASYGTAITLTQTVPTGATGVVTFTASGTVLGTVPILNGVATLTTTSLPGGNNSITGAYAGNSVVNASTSAPTTVTVAPATLTLGPVTSSPSATTYNTPVTLTQLFPAGATGTVTFTSGSLTLGTAPILNGVATLPNIALPVGSNTVTASFAGNNNYTATTSTSSPIVVSPSTATLAAPVASPTNAVFGVPVTFTQAVPSGFSGTVTFTSNNISLGTATIVNGVATLTTSALQGGTNFVIGAAYSGNNNYMPATSATTTIQIAPVPPALATPVISPTTAPAGSPITVIQAVPAGATGTVTFSSGSTVLGTAPIVNGTASFTTAALPVGVNAIAATYPGNNNYTAGTSPNASITIAPVSSALAAPTASPVSSTFGASVTLTQAVPAGATGTVTFSSNGVTLGTATISNGVATLTTSALQGGSNLLATSYSGNGTFAAALSTSGFITVAPATLTLPATSASATTAVPGTPITFTQSFPAGATGTATFSSGSTVLGMVPIVNGAATLTTASLPSGSNSIAVIYPGNNNYSASTSPSVTVTVAPATVTLSPPTFSPTSASYGTSVTLTQTVPAGTTGTITFYNGTTALGTATIVNGVATLTTSALPAGANSITGSYSGGGNYAPGTSAPTVITIAQSTPTLPAPTSSPTSATFGTSVTLTQTVPAGVTGTITFYSGSTSLGTATVVNGVATLTTTALPVGTNAVTASYGGSANYAVATSAPLTVTVTARITPGYTITANPPSLTIHAGSTGTSMLTFLPVGGYSGTFTVVCNNLPANAACQFMQNGAPSNTVVMSGNNQPVLVNLNVVTSVPVAQGAPPAGPFGGKAPLLLNCGLFALIMLGRRRKSLRGAVTLCGSLLMGALLLGGLTGCAGGFGVTATPRGTSVATVTATATGGASASSLNLTITIIQ